MNHNHEKYNTKQDLRISKWFSRFLIVKDSSDSRCLVRLQFLNFPKGNLSIYVISFDKNSQTKVICGDMCHTIFG